MNFFESLIQRASSRSLQRLYGESRYRFFSENPLFRDLSSQAQLFLTGRLIERHYSNQEIIFREGNLGICMFLIRQGSVELSFGNKGEDDVSYSVLSEGALFGEVATVSNNYRTASARAVENDTTLLLLTQFDLEDLNGRYPQDGIRLLRGITDSVIESLIATTKALNQKDERIALLGNSF